MGGENLSMNTLHIKNLWKEYQGQTILERVNLKVSGPEFCTIVGASGCGKSTFLRLLLGQKPPRAASCCSTAHRCPRNRAPIAASSSSVIRCSRI